MHTKYRRLSIRCVGEFGETHDDGGARAAGAGPARGRGVLRTSGRRGAGRGRRADAAPGSSPPWPTRCDSGWCRLLATADGGAVCACDLVEPVGKSQPTVSPPPQGPRRRRAARRASSAGATSGTRSSRPRSRCSGAPSRPLSAVHRMFACAGGDRARSHQRVLIDQASLMDRAVLRAIADPMRQRIVELLAGEQLCTCHLVEELAGHPDERLQPPAGAAGGRAGGQRAGRSLHLPPARPRAARGAARRG